MFSVEFPLTHIDGPEQLRGLVEALVAMREGREDEIRQYLHVSAVTRA